MTPRVPSVFLLLSALLAVGCPTDAPAPRPLPPGPVVGTDPGARTALHRLTATEWRNAAEDLLGARWGGALPEEFALHGYTAIGAAEVTIAPLDFELLESAAWGLAEIAVRSDADPTGLLGCGSATLGAEETALDDAAPCGRAALVPFLSRALRRPAARSEVERAWTLFANVRADSGSALLAAQAVAASTLLSPEFLFRVELGEDGGTNRDRRRLTGPEQAARIAFTLLDRPPDDALRGQGETGGLALVQEIAQAAAASLQEGDATDALLVFFAEWTNLAAVWLATKDAAAFPEWGPALQEALVGEAQALFTDVALLRDEDLRTLFTTSESALTAPLAALYGVAPADPPGTTTTLPPERAGLLTRGAFLAGQAHAALTSPTRRGKFVRGRLLCSDVAPPPPGVVTTLDPDALPGTLRDLLESHRSNPECAACHVQMDPIGFALEHYDPIGRWRTLDAGFPIDATSDLDGVPVDGGAALGAALFSHPRLPRCIASNAFSHLLGHLEQRAERGEVDAVAEALVANGHRLSALVAAVAAGEGFRTVGVPDGGSCSLVEEGRERPCTTACGAGVERCTAEVWSGCTAPRPGRERCNGIDDDCDGDIDGDVIVACEAAGSPGTAACVGGSLLPCVATPVGERCNGLDDDANGLVDDDLAVELVTFTPAELAGAHPACDGANAPHSMSCRAAAHRACSARGCATTGIGPVARDASHTLDALPCLAPEIASVQQTTYTALAAQHGECTASTRFGPACNAAIHRWCSSQGLVTGYGPVENSADVAVVACMPGATVVQTSYTALSSWVPGCSAGGERMGASCDEAFHRLCRSLGHRTGHGPLENSGDVAYAACVGVLP